MLQNNFTVIKYVNKLFINQYIINLNINYLHGKNDFVESKNLENIFVMDRLNNYVESVNATKSFNILAV